jgi:nitrite transporter NirC
MEEQGLQYLVKLAKKKKFLLDHYPIHYLIRAMLASIYAGFVIVSCFKIGGYFFEAGSPAAYLAGSIYFGVALVLIIYGGAELFTGNTMYFTIAAMRKEVTVIDTLKNWAACYAGNLLGAIVFAFLFAATGLFAHLPNDHYIQYVSEYKMNATTLQLFVKGIFCNWLVCLAVFLPTQFKNEGAKLFVIMATVFLFFSSGFEHSIANFVLFGIALTAPHPDTVSIAGAFHNLIPVTLGNIVGGSVFVGMLYQYLSVSNKAYEEADKNIDKKETSELHPMVQEKNHTFLNKPLTIIKNFRLSKPKI